MATRAPSAASKKTRTERTTSWLSKHGVMPKLPHDWTEKEVSLQQLVDLGMLSAAEAAEEVGAGPAPADGGGDAAAAPAAPDLSAKVLLTDSAQSPCALDARLSKLIQTRAHPPDSQMRTHACGRFRRTLDTYRHGMK